MMAIFDEEQSWRLSLKHFSSWMGLIPVHASILCFISNCRGKGHKKDTRELTSEEIEDATSYVTRSSQKRAFSKEYSALQKGVQ